MCLNLHKRGKYEIIHKYLNLPAETLKFHKHKYIGQVGSHLIYGNKIQQPSSVDLSQL